MVFFLFCGGLFLWAATLQMPDLSSFDSRLVGTSTKIYDRTGQILLYDVNQQVRRTSVPFDQISQNIKNATVSIEDESFYTHNGIRITSLIRALITDIFSGGYKQGGSTITQQVIKNSLLSTDKSVSRKLKEIILALKLEKSADKDTILNIYLNQSPYGGNIYGIEEAARAYFGKKASEVSIVEAAYLAAIPQSPTYYSPFGKHKDALIVRKNLVLKQMRDNKLITQAEYDDAMAHDAEFLKQATNALKAPHFVMYIKDYLEQKYGEETVSTGGLKVITTIDYDLESKAEEIVKKYVTENQKKFDAENGSLVAIDPRNGQILVMVGSRDYFDKDISGNFNVATAHRQPGSSFKPFVYSTLFNKGYTPDTILFDTKTEFSLGCSVDGVPTQAGAVCYSPQNYEGKFEGPITIRKALAESRNIPAVKATYMATVEDSIKTAQAMGINQLGTAKQYGLSLALGGAEVSPLDMAEAYGVFAQGGARSAPTGTLQVTDKDGNILEEFATSTEQVIPEQSALLITDILSDRSARAPIFGSKYFGTRDVGMKTGTTNDSRDAWIIGYTPNISVSAWMGNNDNRKMAQKASATIVAPMWKQFMDYALAKLPIESFKKPAPIDTSNLKNILKGVWQDPAGVHDILYYVKKDDPLGPAPTNPTEDPEFNHFEYSVQSWLQENGYPTSGVTIPGSIPTGTTTSGINPTNPTPGGINGNVSIQGFSNGQVVKVGNVINISLSVTPGIQITEVSYILNGVVVATKTASPFGFSFTSNDLHNIRQSNEIKVSARDIYNKFYVDTKTFTVSQ